MTEPLIHLEDVQFAYSSERPVLAGADLALYPGERLGLVGPIGCGKTTLLLLVVGLIKPTGGTVRAFGQVLIRFVATYFLKGRQRLIM